ncbi:MAG: hypothetical protein WCR53_01535 [Bacteroidaceae bacterium]|nr:hypothetical protein [Bacteroidaceae bacterium]
MTRKKFYRTMLLIATMVFCLSLSSCSKEEDMATTYVFKTINVSTAMSSNSAVMYKIQQFLVLQYNEGVQYILTDEGTAKQKFQKAVTDIQNYEWEKNGFTLQDNTSFTLELISNGNTVIVSQPIVLK